ncbi:NADH:flavin oxidoreductase [Hymenobacter sp. BRD128]|uniref:NADH:flavin oxidoreductase n=1 Tax=Hymenobacter sp. BRD128 TaxID=2675878 RepID=UPI001565B84F|nr:NADH:flavin oxidoreductase [Hymenobacter sp. BRD128]QKG58332.1 NADH:flavin oxidoreductase [Hymenobacter sp. BRD128]
MESNALFTGFRLKSLQLPNRIVMAPMTREFSPAGVPGPEVAAYYRRRAEGQVGLILSEGTVVERPASSNTPNVPHFYGERALAGWQHVIDEVHQAGGHMGPQLWHMGLIGNHMSGQFPGWKADQQEGPSGLLKPGTPAPGRAMTEADIADTIAAFGQAAADAQRLGFDCLELHGAHGYLIDQFFWAGVNERTDRYGGPSLPERSRLAGELVREVRRRVGSDFAIILRLSQWKQQDYTAKLAATPHEMEAWLAPLAEAGVDIFHCSQRRFWEPEFAGSDLNFAGWAKKLTGQATITVGSVGLSSDFMGAFAGQSSAPSSLDELLRRLDRQEFDLVAVGRPLLADPDWAEKIRAGHAGELQGFSAAALGTLY